MSNFAMTYSDRRLIFRCRIEFDHELPHLAEIALGEAPRYYCITMFLAPATEEYLTPEIDRIDGVVGRKMGVERNVVRPFCPGKSEPVQPSDWRFLAGRRIHDLRISETGDHSSLINIVENSSSMVDHDVQNDVQPTGVSLLNKCDARSWPSMNQMKKL